MDKSSENEITLNYPVCRAAVGVDAWDSALAACGDPLEPDAFADALSKLSDVPGFLPDLARLEWAHNAVKSDQSDIREEVSQTAVNPTLRLLELSWKNLPSFFGAPADDAPPPEPEIEAQMVLLWREPDSGDVKVRAASDEDLLVLKMVVEGISPEAAADAGGLPVGAVDLALGRAGASGMLLAPRSRIRRDPAVFSAVDGIKDDVLSTDAFTLQWHITQACDLHCKHCYDRSPRPAMKLDKAFGVLDDLRSFCMGHHVRGHVNFSGGNPFLYPHFAELYEAASDRGFGVAILGNPTSRESLERLLDIRQPSFFQVSLEGLEEHNDEIRGRGHFRRTLEFLGLLRELEVYSMVMLTLTRDNMAQVLPLAGMLKDRVDSFNFNRLSMVGEGANLVLPDKGGYIAFLDEYLRAREEYPHIRLKDNLFNILLEKDNTGLFSGCTGYGCGAAFNFISVLADGEAHACRKFPSPLGNVFEQSIAQIYGSETARRYRHGCASCRDCSIRAVCGGCLAISHSFGLDVFEERDPFCFIERLK